MKNVVSNDHKSSKHALKSLAASFAAAALVMQVMAAPVVADDLITDGDIVIGDTSIVSEESSQSGQGSSAAFQHNASNTNTASQSAQSFVADSQELISDSQELIPDSQNGQLQSESSQAAGLIDTPNGAVSSSSGTSSPVSAPAQDAGSSNRLIEEKDQPQTYSNGSSLSASDDGTRMNLNAGSAVSGADGSTQNIFGSETSGNYRTGGPLQVQYEKIRKRLASGQSAQITLKLKNTSAGADAENVRIMPTFPQGLSLDASCEKELQEKGVLVNGTFQLADIRPGETASLTLRLQAGPLSSGAEKLKLKTDILYDMKDAPQNTIRTQAVLFLPVDAAEAPQTETPQTEARQPQSETGEPQSETQEPQSETGEPQSETEEPQSETGEPQSETEEPQSETGEPQSETEEPQSETQEPQSETQEPQSETEEPQSETEEPQSETQEPQTETPQTETPQTGEPQTEPPQTEAGNESGADSGSYASYDDGGYSGYSGDSSGAAKTDPMLPRIMISKYRFDTKPEAGKDFTLSYALLNTSSTLNIENMAVSIDAGDSMQLEDGTNTVYIPKLGPNETYNGQIRLKASPDVKSDGSADLTMSFKYEYMKNTDRTETDDTQKIAVPITIPDRFSAGDVQTTDTITAGEEFTVSLSYVNKGKSAIYNAEAALTTDMSAETTYTYIGTIEAGTSGSADFFVTPQSSGSQKATITLTYEDNDGNEKTITREGTFDVPETESMTEADESGASLEYDDSNYTQASGYDSYGSSSGSGLLSRQTLIPAAGGAGMAAALFLIIHMIRRKKARTQEEDDGS